MSRRAVLTAFAAVFLLLASLQNVECKAKAKSSTPDVPSAFDLDGVTWVKHKSEHSTGPPYFYFNQETQRSQWTDPRKAPPSSAEKSFAVMVFILPFLLLLLLGAGYVVYIRVYFPEAFKRMTAPRAKMNRFGKVRGGHNSKLAPLAKAITKSASGAAISSGDKPTDSPTAAAAADVGAASEDDKAK